MLPQVLVKAVSGPCVKLVVRDGAADESSTADPAQDLWCVGNSAATFVTAASGTKTPHYRASIRDVSPAEHTLTCRHATASMYTSLLSMLTVSRTDPGHPVAVGFGPCCAAG